MSTDWLAEDAYLVFKEKFPELTAGGKLNEATTRLRVIDTILFDVLRWDKLVVEAEKYTRAVGYLDYIFGPDPTYSLILEAKREGTHFVLPDRAYPPEPVPFALIAAECPAAADALRQAQGYATPFGARYSAITNGQQWLLSLTFVSNHVVEDRLVFVFESISALQSPAKFRAFYECFSRKAIDTNLPSLRLLAIRRAPAPAKLSSQIPGYPLHTERNTLTNALRGVLQLVWDEINFDPDNETFLQNCYIVAEPAEDMLRVAHVLLKQRSETDDQCFQAATVEPASKKTILAPSAADYERPMVLLGQIGSAKSTFLKFLRHIEAKDILRTKYIQIDIDFLDRPATKEAVPVFILDQVEHQLKSFYGVELTADKLVRRVLRQDMKEFHSSPRGKLLTAPGREAELANAEVDFIETFTKNREKYLSRLMKDIRHGQGKSIVIFFDNLDRRFDPIQEQAFLAASAIAAEWSALVFVCLRPSTVKRSQSRGVLDTIAPRIIVISPPNTVPMLRKRFQYAARFARRSLPSQAYVRARFTPEIEDALPAAADLFEMCDQSVFKKPALAQQYASVANGNVRLIVKYVRDMLTSNDFNCGVILERMRGGDNYILTEREALQALLFGPYVHYSPNDSLFLNLFDVRRADAAEHFSRLLLLAHCHRHANAIEKSGFVSVPALHAYMSNLGYSYDHITDTISVLFAKKCVEGRDQDEDATDLVGEEIHITSLGSYHVSYLVRRFVYLDAVIVDTPILDDTVRQRIQDVRSLKDRIARARDFLRYLDHSADAIADVEARRHWDDVSHAIAHNITDVEKAAQAVGWE